MPLPTALLGERKAEGDGRGTQKDLDEQVVELREDQLQPRRRRLVWDGVWAEAREAALSLGSGESAHRVDAHLLHRLIHRPR
eukprot:scaffold16864_cov27-Tisochrysis_lutea.AAC.1